MAVNSLCALHQLHQDTLQMPVKCLMVHIELPIFISGPDNGDEAGKLGLPQQTRAFQQQSLKFSE